MAEKMKTLILLILSSIVCLIIFAVAGTMKFIKIIKQLRDIYSD